MPKAVHSEGLLYADNTCLIYTGKNTKSIEGQLKKDFNSLCNWFIDKKLSIHFREEKIKYILFATKQHFKNLNDFEIKHGYKDQTAQQGNQSNDILQHSQKRPAGDRW